MGDGKYDYRAATTRSALRATTGDTVFKYDKAVRGGTASDIPHPDVDLRKKSVRESRDVLGKPPSTPILIAIDHTGSMGELPHMIMQQMHKIMKMIIDGGSVTDPQIAFACFGDANDMGRARKAVLQLGEFEADDVLLEQQSGKLYFAGGGGGGDQESYELLMFVAARQIKTDAFEKRGEKGFLFLIGDESYYPRISSTQLLDATGISIQDSISTTDIVKELLDRWHVMVIRPGGSTHYEDTAIHKSWTKLFGEQHVVNVQDWEDINAQIAGTIAVIAGSSLDDVVASLSAAGFDATSVDSATKALVPLVASTAPIVAGALGDLVPSDSSDLPSPTRF